MNKNQTKYYVELPQDEHNNLSYTAGNPCVIQCEYEPRKVRKGTLRMLGRLRVIKPERIAKSWPTLSERLWLETDGPARDLSELEWRELVKDYLSS